jgi:hypothetical protein
MEKLVDDVSANRLRKILEVDDEYFPDGRN